MNRQLLVTWAFIIISYYWQLVTGVIIGNWWAFVIVGN